MCTKGIHTVGEVFILVSSYMYALFKATPATVPADVDVEEHLISMSAIYKVHTL